MKNLIAMLVVLALIAGCTKPTKPTKASKEPVAEKPAAAVTADATAVEQTICPVMGGAIDKQYFTEYKGKTVYFCCPGCKPEFEKDPEKYIAKLPQFAAPK